MSQLPARGDVMDLEREGDAPRQVLILAIDVPEDVYTVQDVQTGELLLMTFHDDLSWQYLTLVEDPS